jgi:hypothetical protein
LSANKCKINLIFLFLQVNQLAGWQGEKFTVQFSNLKILIMKKLQVFKTIFPGE